MEDAAIRIAAVIVPLGMPEVPPCARLRTLARAKSIPEPLRLQTGFVQQQFAVAGAQTKEVFELWTKLAQQAFESMNSAAAKAFDQMKTAG